jgi:hypothetical protein
VAVALCLLTQTAQAAVLKPQTVAAFEHYIQATEAQMEAAQRSGAFLRVDSLPPDRREPEYARLREGGLYIEALQTLDAGRKMRIPGGMIHHWVGIVFIPGATLPRTLAVLQDYDRHQEIYKPDVQRSKLLERNGDDFKIYLQFLNKSVVTAVVNANLDVHYASAGPGKETARSCSTRIVQVAHYGRADEHELPEGNDSGYMWRLCTYSRIEEKDGGVYFQIEAVSLSRGVPALLAWLVNPLIRSIPRKVLTDLLNATRRAVESSAPLAVAIPQ